MLVFKTKWHIIYAIISRPDGYPKPDPYPVGTGTSINLYPLDLSGTGIVVGGYLLYPHHTRPVAIPNHEHLITFRSGSNGLGSVVGCSDFFMDRCCSSWTNTPAGTSTRIDPSFESTSDPHVVVSDHAINLQTQELILMFAYFHDVVVHGVLVDILLLIDLLNNQQGVVVD